MPTMAHGAMSSVSPTSGRTPVTDMDITAAVTRHAARTEAHPTITFLLIRSSPFHVSKTGMRMSGPPVPVRTEAQPINRPIAASIAISRSVTFHRRSSGMESALM